MDKRRNDCYKESRKAVLREGKDRILSPSEEIEEEEMKFTDLILGLLILFFGGAIGLYILIHLGLTLPIISKDFTKFFGV